MIIVGEKERLNIYIPKQHADFQRQTQKDRYGQNDRKRVSERTRQSQRERAWEREREKKRERAHARMVRARSSERASKRKR